MEYCSRLSNNWWSSICLNYPTGMQWYTVYHNIATQSPQDMYRDIENLPKHVSYHFCMTHSIIKLLLRNLSISKDSPYHMHRNMNHIRGHVPRHLPYHSKTVSLHPYYLAPLMTQFDNTDMLDITLRLRQNGSHFTDGIFKCIFLNENVWILIKVSLKFVRKCLINNNPAFDQIMAVGVGAFGCIL